MNVKSFVDAFPEYLGLDLVMDYAKKRLKPEVWEEFMAADLIHTEALSIAEWVEAFYQRVLEGTSGDGAYVLHFNEGRTLQEKLLTSFLEAGVEIARNEVVTPLTPTEAIMMAQASIA